MTQPDAHKTLLQVQRILAETDPADVHAALYKLLAQYTVAYHLSTAGLGKQAHDGYQTPQEPR